MFLHLSPFVSVERDRVIGIFDMDNATASPDSRAFLRQREREGRLTTTARDLPKSFVVTDDRVYLAQNSPRTLANK